MATAKGPYGLSLRFGDGLVVLRADNTSGKSTLLMSIVYALGLEGMISPSHSPPLQFALTTRLDTEDGPANVLESEVLLEVENAAARRVTIQRAIKHPTRHPNLVSVYDGPQLTQGGAHPKSDFFVRMGGAAQRERGFHVFLSSFIGWSLPRVPKFDGTDSPLYLECIFPLIIVEQKHGWAGIQARMPTYLGIREVGKRATEFLLRLDAYEIAVKKQRLEEEAERLKVTWREVLDEMQRMAATSKGLVRGIPDSPVSQWPPSAGVSTLVYVGDKLLALNHAIAFCRSEIERLEREQIPRVQEVSNALEKQLVDAQAGLRRAETAADQLFREVGIERDQLTSLKERQAALSLDLKNYKDLQRLQGLGSDAELSIGHHECPTCHQSISDSLLPQVAAAVPMSVGENIAFIEDQLATFREMQTDSEEVLRAKESRLAALRANLDDMRRKIRVLRESLISDGRLPSAAAIGERLTNESRLAELQQFESKVATAIDKFGGLSAHWRRVQDELLSLEKVVLSELDRRKLSKLQQSLTSQLGQYAFSSLSPESITVSEETYRPIHEGFDLGVNLSASDTVRLIWAYLNGLLEVSRAEQTNHPGLLLLDEPRQQQTALVSFKEFAKRAGQAAAHGNQVIFATSEETSVLQPALLQVPHEYIEFKTKKLLNRL